MPALRHRGMLALDCLAVLKAGTSCRRCQLALPLGAASLAQLSQAL